ncbi:MAG: hypothetical protein LWX07_12010, partial [Bacteroidetes bacterium]|nr:hypothetical protein [Bacteroidota bacterium]
MEQYLMKVQTGQGTSEISGITSGKTGITNIPESALKEMKSFYGFDKPVMTRYFEWVGNPPKLNFGKSY